MSTSAPRSARLLVALSLAALVAVASYALQRLWDAQTEPPLGSVVTQATIPYYWRVGGALVHAAMAGVLGWFGLGEEAASRWIPRLPALVVLVVLPAAVAMVLVP